MRYQIVNPEDMAWIEYHIRGYNQYIIYPTREYEVGMEESDWEKFDKRLDNHV